MVLLRNCSEVRPESCKFPNFAKPKVMDRIDLHSNIIVIPLAAQTIDAIRPENNSATPRSAHMKFWATSSAALLALNIVGALDAHGWRQQSIYQLLTDRFSREDDVEAPCNLIARQYCGGTWKGISESIQLPSKIMDPDRLLVGSVDKLDYIQVSSLSKRTAGDIQLTDYSSPRVWASQQSGSVL